MSACRTCSQIANDMPQRVVAFVDGVTHIQKLEPGRESEGLLKAAKFLLALAEQKAKLEMPTNG